ncbi:MAG: patatin-like phospholipase family protein [Gammaproteobacteria bacterium]
MKITYHYYLALLSVVFLTSCASYQKNVELEQYNPNIGYRYNVVEKMDNKENSDSLFVVVTFSGGGTRAAALAYGVLQQLRDTRIVWDGQKKRLLDEVDIISSVSGGSFTSAYYGLNRDAIFNGDYEKNYLKHDVEKDLFWKLFNPVNWFKLASADYGRSDMVNEYYQKNLFGTKTFLDLQKRGKPFLMINGTDMTTGGQFPFIQDQFDLLCSNLDQYPVSRAVATSSAFPGLLTPLTYNNYAGNCKYKEPLWVSNGADDVEFNPEGVQFIDDRRSYYDIPSYKKPRKFIHIMDGGVADNLGMRSLSFGLENTGPEYSILRKINNKKIKKIVLIVVNAATDPANDLDQSASVPGTATTVITSATIPLDNYTVDTISRAKNAINAFDEDVKLVKKCNSRLKQACPRAEPIGKPLVEIDSYVSAISFDAISDPEQRYWFKNLPTNFNLPATTVDKLTFVGRDLLKNSKAYKMLLKEIGVRD